LSRVIKRHNNAAGPHDSQEFFIAHQTIYSITVVKESVKSRNIKISDQEFEFLCKFSRKKGFCFRFESHDADDAVLRVKIR
jgi:hypothetical protein